MHFEAMFVDQGNNCLWALTALMINDCPSNASKFKPSEEPGAYGRSKVNFSSSD